MKSATHLKPKDSKALPDIVCHLAVVPTEWQMDSSFCQQDTMEWQQRELVKEVKTTKFASATLSPVWNESFELYVAMEPPDKGLKDSLSRKSPLCFGLFSCIVEPPLFGCYVTS